MDKPIVSARFDLEDIRRIRDYNSMRHAAMTHAEIIADTHEGAAALLQELINRPGRKPITILSGDRKTVIEAPAS